ncbi:hypothetical protein [Frankia sp. AgB32]|uniref:hypothetical protein n=1 Tax=Frankia sp. AgB32 TaxID=631119 RepID=UPI00200DC2FD|nr:hypothetical protein [Frankia sp. AgB32]MCK9895071.1 hypothetical protein [Frankia sp. AgB32]
MRTVADRKEVGALAERLLQARDDGLVSFGDDVTNPKTRELTDGASARWLKSMVNAPEGLDLSMSPDLARVLDRMLSAAERRRADGATGVDFAIMSLYRPDKGPSPHRDGAAVDIGVYAGKTINFMRTKDSVLAVAQFYRDMLGGEGEAKVDAKIALGLPRNPRMDPAGALAEYYDAGHPEKKNYYDITSTPGRVITEKPFTVANTRPVLKMEYQVPDAFFQRELEPDRSPAGGLAGAVAALRPEAQQAFKLLVEKDVGKVLRFMFPDGLDHLHVQVVRR